MHSRVVETEVIVLTNDGYGEKKDGELPDRDYEAIREAIFHVIPMSAAVRPVEIRPAAGAVWQALDV